MATSIGIRRQRCRAMQKAELVITNKDGSEERQTAFEYNENGGIALSM